MDINSLFPYIKQTFLSWITRWSETEWIIGLTLVVGVGFLLIFIDLLFTKHAHTFPQDTQDLDPEVFYFKCGDYREKRDAVIFGGADAFTFGFWYLVWALWLEKYVEIGWWPRFLQLIVVCFFLLQFVLSIVELLVFTMGVIFAPKETKKFVIKAHTGGCGLDTASNIYFPAYWLQKWSHQDGIATIRDIPLIFLNFPVSAIIIFFLANIITLITRHVWTVVTIGGVDIKNPHHGE
jgi:hypothetical protein